MYQDEDQKKALIWSYEVVGLEQKDATHEKLEQELANYLDRLIVEDFDKLVSILYRIDVEQEKATAALAANSDKETAGHTMARLIITRQLQKVNYKRKHNQL